MKSTHLSVVGIIHFEMPFVDDCKMLKIVRFGYGLAPVFKVEKAMRNETNMRNQK